MKATAPAVHVIPTGDDEPEHDESSECWCKPTLIQAEEDWTDAVWSHNRTQ